MTILVQITSNENKKYAGQISDILKRGQVKNIRKRRVCVTREINVDEARKIYVNMDMFGYKPMGFCCLCVPRWE